MAGVDIHVFDFDFDLTFCVLLMNADGTIYHTYGGRDWTDPQSHLSMKAFVDVLRKTVREHEAYSADPRPPKKRPKLTVERIPPMAERIRKGKQPTCYHCHTVHDMLHEDRKQRGAWKRADTWIWPDPVEVGLRLDKEKQAVVRAVEAKSAAARAGIRPTDRLTSLGGRRVLTFGDVQRVLDEAPHGATSIPVTWMRAEGEKRGALRLPAQWKEADPRVYAWRPSKWPLSPKPGFGGRELKRGELTKLGLAEDAFAFRVGYVVTWGPNAHTGRNARKAGIRKGDIVTSIGGKVDFDSVSHFHAWFRLTQKAGSKVEIVRYRKGKKAVLTMDVIE